jgi:hypothetical protein
MRQEAIFGPFFAMFLLTLLVWVTMYSRRIPFVRRNQLTQEQMGTRELARISPAAVANPADNLRNLLELPTLFYALALCLYVTHRVDTLFLAAAWVFTAFRVLHSLVHCTINIVILRFWLYVVSSMALWFMAARAALEILGA